MEHHDDPEVKRLEAAVAGHIASYAVIAEMLAGLPVPVEIPPMSDDWDSAAALLVRARTVSREEPISGPAAGLVDTVILDWLTGYDTVAVIKVVGIAPWRLDALDLAQVRVSVGLTILRQELGG